MNKIPDMGPPPDRPPPPHPPTHVPTHPHTHPPPSSSSLCLPRGTAAPVRGCAPGRGCEPGTRRGQTPTAAATSVPIWEGGAGSGGGLADLSCQKLTSLHPLAYCEAPQPGIVTVKPAPGGQSRRVAKGQRAKRSGPFHRHGGWGVGGAWGWGLAKGWEGLRPLQMHQQTLGDLAGCDSQALYMGGSGGHRNRSGGLNSFVRATLTKTTRRKEKVCVLTSGWIQTGGHRWGVHRLQRRRGGWGCRCRGQDHLPWWSSRGLPWGKYGKERGEGGRGVPDPLSAPLPLNYIRKI